MGKTMIWETKLDVALTQAKAENKHILLDFFNPGWIGCKQMDAVTYPNEQVIEFIQKHLIPLRVAFDAQPLSTDFNLKWTPTLITLDADGKEHQRTVGFLSPEELIPSLLLGIAKSHFDRERFNEALSILETLLKDHSKSDSAPEAIYLRGVCKYKSTHNPKPLKEAYEQLQAKYPSSEWMKRAYPYRLL